MKSKIVQWLGIAISVLFIILLIRSLQLDQVTSALAAANYWWLIPAVLASLISFIFRGERFRMFLASLKAFSLWRSYQYIAINYMANNILPARAGEILLSYIVRQYESIPVSSSLAVTVLGRVLDGLLLLTGLILAIVLLPFPDWVTRVAIIGLFAFGGAFTVLMWLIFGDRHHQAKGKRIIERLTPASLMNVTQVLLRWADQFRQGLLPMRHARISGVAILLSMCIWICEGTVYWSIGQVFDLGFSGIQLLFILSLANLATSIPSGPAGIGTFEGVVVIGLTLIGISPSVAAAYALILHATQVLPVTIIGLVTYVRLSIVGLADLDDPRIDAQT